MSKDDLANAQGSTVSPIFGPANFFSDRDPLDNPVWGDHLLEPRSFEYYKSRFGPKRNELSLSHGLYGKGDTLLGFRLFVDGEEVRPRGIISPFELLRATFENGTFYIHTCTCHIPECAGIRGGTVVVQREGLAVWITDTEAIQSLFLFDLCRFRNEVLHSCQRAVELLDDRSDLMLNMEFVTVENLRRSIKTAEEKIALRTQQSRSSRN